MKTDTAKSTTVSVRITRNAYELLTAEAKRNRRSFIATVDIRAGVKSR